MGYVWGAAIAIGGPLLLLLIRRGFKGAVEDVVKPFGAELVKHMRAEEEARGEMRDALADIKAQFQVNEIHHVAFDERLKRGGL